MNAVKELWRRVEHLLERARLGRLAATKYGPESDLGWAMRAQAADDETEARCLAAFSGCDTHIRIHSGPSRE